MWHTKAFILQFTSQKSIYLSRCTWASLPLPCSLASCRISSWQRTAATPSGSSSIFRGSRGAVNKIVCDGPVLRNRLFACNLSLLGYFCAESLANTLPLLCLELLNRFFHSATSRPPLKNITPFASLLSKINSSNGGDRFGRIKTLLLISSLR